MRSLPRMAADWRWKTILAHKVGSVLGQDYLDVRAAASKLKSDGQAVRDQALAKLTPDQKTRAQECLAAQKGAGARFGHFAG